jgi:hypothetical protein
MIWVVGKDACRTEYLLGQHDPHHFVGPCHAAHGQQQMGTGAQFITQTFRAANQKLHMAMAKFRVGFQSVGKGQR